MQLLFHPEGGDPTARAYIEAFAPTAVAALGVRIGRIPESIVQLVFSDHDTHQRRFPPRLSDIEDLHDLTELRPERRLEEARRLEYGFAVTTLADVAQAPPLGILDGQTVIYFDCDHLCAIASRLGVGLDSLVGAVTLHELSHAARGHASAGERTHGWYREGDAQRDAWAGLTDLLIDSAWVSLARRGRAAMARLCPQQPAAYRCFEPDHSELARLRTHDPEPPGVWVQKPFGCNIDHSRCESVEIPVAFGPPRPGMGRAVPVVGDIVYLTDTYLTSGPWAVVSGTSASRVAEPAALAAVQKLASHYHTPSVAWVTLRAPRDLRANDDWEPRAGYGSLEARRLDLVETADIESRLVESAAKLIAAKYD